MNGEHSIIIPSIGRSGSTLLANLLSTSIGLPKKFVKRLSSLSDSQHTQYIIKTHDLFRGELPFPYKAIYMYGDIFDIYASLYKRNIVFWFNHQRHLFSSLRHTAEFLLRRFVLGKKNAFCYFIRGDKFRLEENYYSWQDSSSVLFIKYIDLCADKDKTLKEISSFLGFEVDDFEVKKRKATQSVLPEAIISLIKAEHKRYIEDFTSTE